jgi:hypothetical protein
MVLKSGASLSVSHIRVVFGNEIVQALRQQRDLMVTDGVYTVFRRKHRLSA